MDMMPPSDFDPNSQEGWAAWDLCHIVAHQELGQALSVAGYASEAYPLDYEDNSATWKDVHQQEHESINVALNQIQPTWQNQVPNLSDVDFNDKSQFRDWMYAHALAHQVANEILGI